MTFCTFGLWAQDCKMTVEMYISKYKDLAISEMLRTKIPASITLAQGLLESGAGNSRLAAEGNNHFGIKCKKGWSGNSMQVDDDAPNECFRVYTKPEESYRDHSDFLVHSKRYATLFLLPSGDYVNWAKGLKDAGYATNPKYPDLIISFIEKYDLNLFDDSAQNKEFIVNKQDIKNEPEFSNNSKEKMVEIFTQNENQIKQEKVKKEDEQIYPALNNNSISSDLSKGSILYFYGHKAYITSIFDDIHLIAVKTGVLPQEILDYNELTLDDPIEAQTVLYLEPKQKNNKEKLFHTVQKGESMYFISQYYCIKKSALMEMNKMQDGEEPLEGELIYLQEDRIVTPQLLLPNKQRYFNLKYAYKLNPSPDESKAEASINKNIVPTTLPSRGKSPIIDSTLITKMDSTLKSLESKMNKVNVQSKSQIDHSKKSNTDSSVLYIQQKTKETDKAQIVVEPKDSKPNAIAPAKKSDYYIIEQGETLYSISRKLGIPLDKLKLWNGLVNDGVPSGQILKITEK